MATPIALEVGFLVELEENNGKKYNSLIHINRHGDLCISCEEMWFYVNSLSNDFKYEYVKVNKVYGRTGNNKQWSLETYDRNLLWERETPKELTVEQLEEILGYKIKVVGGK